MIKKEEMMRINVYIYKKIHINICIYVSIYSPYILIYIYKI